MSKIDYQALREAAERAIPAMERLLMLPADDDLLSEQELKDYGVDIDALNAFKFLAGPETALALLDELEAKDKQIDYLKAIASHSNAGWKEAHEQEARAEAAEKRIAELEPLTAPRLPQPSPVSVPDEIDKWQAIDDMRDYDESFRWDSSDGYEAGWNACRAAMLQGAEPAQGWIPCSERMPGDRESVLLWDIDLDDACSGHYSHQTGNFYQAGMLIDNEITHWMPLPAAPQQEVTK